MKRASLFLVLVGCGFSPGGNAARDGGPGIDAALVDAPDAPLALIDGPPDAALDAAPLDAPAPTCLSHWHDDTVSVLAIDALTQLNTTGIERDPFLTPDERDIYFAREGDIYKGHRSSLTASFGNVHEVSSLSSSGDDSKVSITGDGAFATITSDRSGGNLRVYGATLNAMGTDWVTPSQGPFTMLDSTAISPLYDAEIAPDGQHLYLAPKFSGVQGLAVSTRDATLGFVSYAPIPSANQGGNAADPSIADGDTILIFSSDRAGDDDLWYITRASPNDEWGPPHIINSPVLNDAADEGDPHLSADGCRLYFARNPGGNAYDLYVATIAL